MTHRSTTRVQPPARRPRPARRVRQSLAVTMMVVGLVVGAFAAPSMAEDAPAVEVASLQDDAPTASGLEDLPPGQGGENPGNGGDSDGPPPYVPGDDCELPEVDSDYATPGCQPVVDTPDPECPGPEGDQNGPLPGCEPIDEGCPPGQVEGDGGCTTPGGGTPGGGTPGGGTPGGGTPGGGTPGGGTPGGGTPGGGTPGGGTPGGGTPGGGTPSTGGTPSNGVGGTIGGGGNPSLGTTLGVAEGSVPGSQAATAVSSCSDSVICQSAPAATSTGSSTTGLPQTGAPADSRQLVALGLGLLLAGGLLLKPGRRGRHRLVGA